MSISQDSAATIVCREVFDETSHPSNEEVLDYARRLGIDPDAELHLLELAREGLMAALPKGWSPCFHEASGAWYYYQASTGTTTWEHPLDAVYRGLVEQARAGNVRQMSVEEDSKTTAKELESHEEATLPTELAPVKESPKPTPQPTKIPTKLTPLKKYDRADGARKRDSLSQERLHSRRESDSRSDNPLSLSTDRAARDYTNLRFQDPKFYECPKLLETASTTVAASSGTTRKDLDLKEVLKRSESLSPRYEKDWEQLSGKFNSEENIIDIDKLSITTLARSERPEKFDKEKHPSQFGQQKELTLSGGGTMFLKSNRSRDTTPSQDGNKLEDFRALAAADEACGVVGDRLKSILREKQPEDDDRPMDEERKSVRFDLEKEVDIKFTYSGSEDEWESESEKQNVRISAVVTNKVTGAVLSGQRASSQSLEEDNRDDTESRDQDEGKRSSSSEKSETAPKSSKIVGRRFLVQNVSENEHLSQMARESLSRESSADYVPSSRFENVKNIDLMSKSETDCSVARSSDSDELRKSRSVVERARKSVIRFSNEQLLDEDESSDLSRLNQDAEAQRRERYVRVKAPSFKVFEDIRAKMNREHEVEVEELKKEFERKLEQTKKELEKNFIEEKAELQRGLDEKLEELKREMAEKEEREIQKLIAEMDETRLENLKKVKGELEVCYEKERQEILANLKTELDERKRELLELRNQEMGKLENEHERDLSEEKLAKLSEYELTKQHTEKIGAMKEELEKEFDELRTELRMQQREKITKITEDHEKYLAEILRDFRIDEGLTRKMYKRRLEEIRADYSRDAEKEARKQTERAIQQETMDFEKMRCEKHLLQEKYTALKDKYLKLKNDVRVAVEKRSKRREGYTTASETERSASTRTRTEKTESSEQNTPVRNLRPSSATNPKVETGQGTSEHQAQDQSEPAESKGQKPAAGFQRCAGEAGSKGAAKFESDDTTTASETNANMMRKRKNFTKKAASAGRSATGSGNNNNNNNNNNLENPVENIRKQLEKLEDLGDQLPSNETAYTLRYPFQDKGESLATVVLYPCTRVLFSLDWFFGD
ncbi:hypothetical protein KM043_018421 [Ampulex compressa]|nr:hypothetical protein KM043_018421 [Ampulex compressa]